MDLFGKIVSVWGVLWWIGAFGGWLRKWMGEEGEDWKDTEKRLTQTRTAWMSGGLGNGRILEWKPFLIGFRLEFGGIADEVIARRVKKYLLHKMHSRWDSS